MAEPALQQYVRDNVRRTGTSIGSGSYGTVEEVELDGLVCAGKRMHAVLLEFGEGFSNFMRRFEEECGLLSSLHHPNIVQFLGIHFASDSDRERNVPMLLMERMMFNLDNVLENNPDIPLGIKSSILHDVALGLRHLHSRSVVHRDLSARNILLTSAMTAKISDLGVARILEGPGSTSATLTRAPGALHYMPPEVMTPNPRYNVAVDIFSFGHLALFTITQRFIEPTAPTRIDPNGDGRIIAVTEVERRQESMELLSRQLPLEHPLIHLVTKCLNNDPRNRPYADEVQRQLSQILNKTDDPYTHTSKLELIQHLRKAPQVQGRELKELQLELRRKDETLQAKDRVIQTLTRQLEEVNQGFEAPNPDDPNELQNVPREFRGNDQLRQWVLRANRGTKLGSGAYGHVYELLIDGDPRIYAGKQFQESCGTNISKFVKEFLILSGFRHDNVVHYHGVTFLRQSQLPVLVMERLQINLHDYLEGFPESIDTLPTQSQVALLIDVASGLEYLHSQGVLHRDLTAKNVLLTRYPKAKISDFGNSRVFDPNASVQTMSACPGTRVYMPPEAFSTKYDSKLDVFSFGHLALFIATQKFPSEQELLPATYKDRNSPGKLCARKEVERRQEYFDKLERDHPLTVLTAECLHNDPERRPSPTSILATLSQMGSSQPPSLFRDYKTDNIDIN